MSYTDTLPVEVVAQIVRSAVSSEPISIRRGKCALVVLRAGGTLRAAGIIEFAQIIDVPDNRYNPSKLSLYTRKQEDFNMYCDIVKELRDSIQCVELRLPYFKKQFVGIIREYLSTVPKVVIEETSDYDGDPSITGRLLSAFSSLQDVKLTEIRIGCQSINLLMTHIGKYPKFSVQFSGRGCCGSTLTLKSIWEVAGQPNNALKELDIDVRRLNGYLDFEEAVYYDEPYGEAGENCALVRDMLALDVLKKKCTSLKVTLNGFPLKEVTSVTVRQIVELSCGCHPEYVDELLEGHGHAIPQWEIRVTSDLYLDK